MFRGRQIEHMDRGRKLIDKFVVDTHMNAQIEKEPSMEGRTITMVLAPKK
jgi:translation initiation factor IF-3